MELAASAVERLIVFFPKLFFLVPTMPPHKVKIEEQTILMSEPMDCLLWLLEILAQENQESIGGRYCLQNELEALVALWYPPTSERRSGYNFSKPIRKLVKAGFVRSERYEVNARISKLALTPQGEKLLAVVKAKRMEKLTALLQGLPEDELNAAIPFVEQLATAAWQTMKTHASAVARHGKLTVL